ncbi:MAG: putative sugar O-methyltransferase [Labilithrix sp.]|nr:putative sugar O-methyltransferase [Labilithrix sp.]MBX3220860.1 putative sugar O-methyltransferase [Labilithrix sp.]
MVQAGAPASASDRADAARRLARVLALRGPMLARAAVGHLRPDTRVDAEWRERYERARRDLDANDAVFRPTKQWRLISSMFRMMLRGFGLRDFKSTFGRFLAAYEPENRRYFEALHHVYLSTLERRDTWGLLETLEEPDLGQNDTVVVRGRRFSMDLLQSVDELYRLVEVMGWSREDPVVVCEIGAGYGRLAHVVLSAMPNARYFVFDLPESLLLAQYYLTSLHPDSKALLYPESAEAGADGERRWADARIAFGLPHQLRSLVPGSVDAVVNIYSFMEMAPAQVATYFDLVERLDPKALFIKQHKHEVNLLENSLLTSAGYPVRPTWRLAHEGTSALYENVFEAIYRVRS